MKLTPKDRKAMRRFLARHDIEQRLARWCPIKPTEKQLDAMLADDFELLFGGAMGGGKSRFLLMDALRFVDVPGYQAIIVRQSLIESDRMGGVLDVAKQWWLGKPGVAFDSRQNTFTFDGKGRITFGYMKDAGSEHQFDGTEFQRAYIDELQNFTWQQYSYLFQRTRGAVSIGVPWAARSSAMPGGPGQDWVRERFIKPAAPDPGKPWVPEHGARKPRFIAAVAGDNPHLSEDYSKLSLASLDHFTRESRGKGNWDIAPDGNIFKREWFPIVEQLPNAWGLSVRFWDFAATEKKPGKDPDATASARVTKIGDIYYVTDVTEHYASPQTIERVMGALAESDGHRCAIRMEEERGSSGAHLTSVLRRHVLRSYDFAGVPPIGDKLERSRPLSMAAERRQIVLVRGAWNDLFIGRMCAFPVGKRDVTDAASGAYAWLYANGTASIVAHDPGDAHRTLTSTLWRNRSARMAV